MPHADIRENLIRRYKLGKSFSCGDEEKDLGAVNDVGALKLIDLMAPYLNSNTITRIH